MTMGKFVAGTLYKVNTVPGPWEGYFVMAESFDEAAKKVKAQLLHEQLEASGQAILNEQGDLLDLTPLEEIRITKVELVTEFLLT